MTGEAEHQGSGVTAGRRADMRGNGDEMDRGVLTQQGTVSVVFAGLGGQGVITVSDILADAAFAEGYDVKKSDIHGMAQRGGAVSSDVRFGSRVLSPMIAAGKADYVVVLDEAQVNSFRYRVRPGGEVLVPSLLPEGAILDKRSTNIALLGLLALRLTLPPNSIESAMLARLKPKLHADSLQQFRQVVESGRSAARTALRTASGVWSTGERKSTDEADATRRVG